MLRRLAPHFSAAPLNRTLFDLAHPSNHIAPHHATLHHMCIMFAHFPPDVSESDVWLADMNYRVAVTQQARVWKGVSAKLADLFGRMKDIEVERRMVRGFVCACTMFVSYRSCGGGGGGGDGGRGGGGCGRHFCLCAHRSSVFGDDGVVILVCY